MSRRRSRARAWSVRGEGMVGGRHVQRIRGWRPSWRIGSAVLAAALGLTAASPAAGQDELVERKGPPKLDGLESDANKDGIPDGWYNARDVSWVAEGGAPSAGPPFLRFQCNAPARPARISRAFGVDGSQTEAILLGLWVRQGDIQLGERTGAEPTLMIEFFGAELRPLSHNALGPWTYTVGGRWTR